MINACEHRWKRELNCLCCGAFNYKSETVKTNKYASPFHFNLKHYMATLRRGAARPTETHSIAEDTHALLSSICEKFMFTSETLALGLYLYQSTRKMHPCERFWASAALIVAAKGVELDKNVPYLNRYQRYAEKAFTQQEYEQAERTILESLSF